MPGDKPDFGDGMGSATPTPPGHGLPSQYGRSCTGCARAKCRCVYRSEGDGCERCHRLRRECTPSVSVRKRKFDASNTPRRRRLEDKIDDLVTVLRAQASSNSQNPGPQASIPTPTVYGSQISTTSDGSVAAHDSPNAKKTTSGGSTWVHESPNTNTTSSHPGIVVNMDTGMAGFVPQASWVAGATTGGHAPSFVTNCVLALDIPAAMADEQLLHFRTAFLPHFAVFHIPTGTNSAVLRREQPFLWLVIMSLTAPSLETQTKLGDAIRKIMMQQVMMDEERSLDFLLGLLCFNAWSYYHKKERSPILIWSQLAASVAFDLGLHRDVPQDDHQLRTQRTSHRQRRTLAERRVFLATYLITSSTWLMLGKMEPIRRTAYLDDCMKILIEEKESDLDGLLVMHVRCHLVMDQITLCLSNLAQRSETSEGIPSYLIRALEAQLSEIRMNLSTGLLQNRAASLCLARAEVVVKSAHLHSSSLQSANNLPDFERLQNLECIAKAIQSWIRLYNEIPPAEFRGLTTSAMAQLSHCVMLLFRLTTLRELGWDTEDLKRRVDCLQVLENAAGKMENLPSGRCVNGEGAEGGPVVMKGPVLLRALKAVLAEELAKAGSYRGEVAPVGSEGPMCEPLFSTDVLADFAMEPWFDEMLATSL